MKHIQPFDQFINEKKDEKYTARIEDTRSIGGTDKDVKDDWNLDVKNRSRKGFDLVGKMEDIQAFLKTYYFSPDHWPEIEVYESAKATNEKKDEKYTARIEDSRKPGGSDKDIKKDYGLDVENRDRYGFDIVGTKEDVEAFIENYGIVTDVEVYESNKQSSENALNEAVEKYYTIDWNRQDAKTIFDYKNKIMNLAEKGMKALPTILEETAPGLFDIDNLGFSFKGNAAFVFANVKNQNERFKLDYGKIGDDKEFKKYFDLAGANLDSGSSKAFSSYFRIDDRKI